MNTLAGLGPDGKNNLGQFIPVATADTTTYQGSDYYEIGVRDYSQRFHSDLPGPTRLRGYYQKNLLPGDASGAGENHYLGPVIIARKDRPVRIKFSNEVGTGAAGNLFVPVDRTLMGVGMGPDGSPYTDNRATLHLHGGNNPWISDGTQHQWTVPAGETGTTLKKGLSVADVPDMPPTGDGELTFFWPNQQSSRLLFYHDHAYGITRLNVYAGEAAGYLLVDDVEDGLISSGAIPNNGGGVYNYGIPLVIQDKTFVHGDKGAATGTYATDPTWGDILPASSPGDLWLPHVYMPNQWPDNPDWSGANAMGRWDYGPWFWPPYTGLTYPPITVTGPDGQLTEMPSLPNPSIVPEAFMDTPIVNGTAYPVLPVAPATYRFRILNACNDRFMNLQLYIADPAQTKVPAVLPTDLDGAGALRQYGTEVKMIPAVSTGPSYPATWPIDNRDGGVPDPLLAGPSMIQIGTEGGLLPAPVVIPPTPIGYNYNRRDIVVLNVANHALFLGPAERADVIIDFSGIPDGTSVILYNDAPAPVPAFDPRYDYYTGDADLTEMGGAPTTQPGMGPNTRTIMQFQVTTAAGPQGAAFNLAGLQTALPAAFAAAHPAPIVPESGYNAAYAANYVDKYVRVQDTGFTYFDGPLGGISVTKQGTGYSATPTVTITTALGDNGSGATATATVTAGKITAITLTNPGSGYKTPPIVQITDPTGSGAAALPVGTVHALKPKAIQELFEPDYGRMNAILGVEIPNTSATIQTTIPYYNFDPPTEIVKPGEAQYWKITHNGVDTHAIHFHLFDVQIINRVGWDGAVRPPDANELGWKDTVRMNPLEDIIVALRPTGQNLPWQLPNSIRPMDVTRAVGFPTGFTAVDPFGNPFPIVNETINYGYEYVWHCHLLGHEENDMMRPVILTVAPTTPSGLAASGSWGTTRVTWQDTALNETGFILERARDAAFTSGVTDIAVPPAANIVNHADGSVGAATVTFNDAGTLTKGFYYYRVRATNGVGHPTMPGTSDAVYSPWSETLQWPIDNTPPVTTATLSGTQGSAGWYRSTVRVTLRATDNLTGVAATYYTVDGGAQQTYAAPFNVTGNLSHTITFWSVDNVGNVETPHKTASVKIDGANPVTSATVAGTAGTGTWYRSSVTVTLGATDPVSGVAATYYTLDGEARRTYLGSFSITADGVHTLTYWSVDVAGNTEATHSRTIGIDKVAPSLAITTTTPASVNHFANSTRSVSVSGTVSDALSLLATGGLTYTVTAPAVGATAAYSGLGTFNVTTAPAYSFTTVGLPLSVARTYTITLSARDNAGNITTATTTFVVR
ncbi:MAG TPA: hypothetical protein DCM86_18215 [Verrucomicrobiales bacterium]|nr:hypothetical protein [Verrucomicrobiales bacterium]